MKRVEPYCEMTYPSLPVLPHSPCADCGSAWCLTTKGPWCDEVWREVYAHSSMWKEPEVPVKRQACRPKRRSSRRPRPDAREGRKVAPSDEALADLF